MHPLLLALAKEHHLANATTQALAECIEQLIQDSLQSGQSVLHSIVESEPSVPHSTMSLKKKTPRTPFSPLHMTAPEQELPLLDEEDDEETQITHIQEIQHDIQALDSLEGSTHDVTGTDDTLDVLDVDLQHEPHRLKEDQPDSRTPLQSSIESGSATTLSMRSQAELQGVVTSSKESETQTALSMPPLRPEERYELLGILGTGGMGRVERVKDWRLNRILAMKILHPSWLQHPEWVQKFIEEAQATSQLQHPGIAPVHDLGQFEDGRFFFTMKHVVGRTLGEVIEEVHHSVQGGQWQTTPSGWSFRRLIDAFHRVCEAVAYAHGQGVLHRDLKPENVMVGEHGEVKVVDWGLVKRAPQYAAMLEHSVEDEDDAESTLSLLSNPNAFLSQEKKSTTQFGEVKGTPAYMSPEQAAGEVDQIGAATDVYGLGAILYQILSGSAPYSGKDVRKVLFQILSEAPVRPGRLGPEKDFTGTLWEDAPALPETEYQRPALPFSLVEICGKALARSPQKRYSNASEIAHEMEMWLEGAQKKERAFELIDEAQSIIQSAIDLRESAKQLQKEATHELQLIHSWYPEEKKQQGWEKQDKATQLEWESWLKEVEAEQKLQAALSHVPNLEEAHAALVSRYGRLHQEAESERRAYSQMRAERYLQSHTTALPAYNPTYQRAIAYLKGDGCLSLKTDPPGSSVLLYRYVKEHRRIKPVFVRFLGETPLTEVKLGIGSYLLLLRKDGFEEARYPVCIERMEHWNGCPPGEQESAPIVLQSNGSMGRNECYIPGGWFWAGGDKEAINALARQRLWVDSFIMQRFAVTNTQYIAFLDDLVAQGRETEAMRYLPRERPGSSEEQGAPIYGRTPEGGFMLRPDAEGDIWFPNYPVLMVDWFGAQAYARWFAKKTRLPWRLPSELEWEKAARGVDGRLFPWGDFLDPSWCCMRESRPGRPLPSVLGRYEEDQSPYGVRDMAGNVRDWCLEMFEPNGPATIQHRVQIPLVSQKPDDTFMEAAPRILRVRRGGGWDLSATLCRAAGRSGEDPSFRDYMSSFRLVRSLW